MLNQSEIIKKNLHFILSHLNNQEHVFPRSIMTLKTKGPIFSDSEDGIFEHFLESEFKDCKINGYPLLIKMMIIDYLQSLSLLIWTRLYAILVNTQKGN